VVFHHDDCSVSTRIGKKVLRVGFLGCIKIIPRKPWFFVEEEVIIVEYLIVRIAGQPNVEADVLINVKRCFESDDFGTLRLDLCRASWSD